MKNKKTIHKLVALLLSISMIPALSPIKGAEAASKNLFCENFESFEAGVIKEATEHVTGNFGNIHYELYTGDKIEIVEDNGNKYLKFTRKSTSVNNSYVVYEFPSAYDNQNLTVSYDFRPEVHSQYFSRFGTLVDDVNAYLADSTYNEVAYPKDATITNNYFYGSTVGQNNYLEIYDRVKTYGTYSDNVTSTDVPEYSIPDCGANN